MMSWIAGLLTLAQVGPLPIEPVPSVEGAVEGTGQPVVQSPQFDTKGLADAASEATTKINLWFVKAQTFLQTEGPKFAVNLIGALIIFFIGKWLIGILARIVERMLARAKIDETLVSFLSNILYYFLMMVVVMASLELVGIQTNSLTAMIAAAGFAIGLALQGSLSNFAAGVMLIVFKPFRVGDMIEAGGVTGNVEEIQVFNTIMRTPDNVEIIVPNGAITSARISNYTTRGTRRVDLVIGCAYADDILAVKEYLNEILQTDPRILRDPAPAVAVAELGQSSVNFNVRPWVKSADYGAVKADLQERIKLGFDEQGFHFPFPSRELYLHKNVV
ncbi:MAG: mechanosensitive ion channel [Planctomycetaceae bacterium]